MAAKKSSRKSPKKKKEPTIQIPKSLQNELDAVLPSSPAKEKIADLKQKFLQWRQKVNAKLTMTIWNMADEGEVRIKKLKRKKWYKKVKAAIKGK